MHITTATVRKRTDIQVFAAILLLLNWNEYSIKLRTSVTAFVNTTIFYRKTKGKGQQLSFISSLTLFGLGWRAERNKKKKIKKKKIKKLTKKKKRKKESDRADFER